MYESPNNSPGVMVAKAEDAAATIAAADERRWSDMNRSL
jgi:hypothetical protein